MFQVDTNNTKARAIYSAKLPGYIEFPGITHCEVDTHHYEPIDLFSRDEEKTPEVLSAFDTVYDACKFDHGSEGYVFAPILDDVFYKFTGRSGHYDIPQDKYGLAKTYKLPETYMGQMGIGEGYHSWASVPVEYLHDDTDARLLAYYDSAGLSSRTLTKGSGFFILQHNEKLVPFCANPFYHDDQSYPDGRLTLFWSRHLLQRLKFNAAVIHRLDEDR